MITASQIIEDNPQIDGRRYVTERHTDSVKGILLFTYMAEAGANVNQIMADRVTQYNAHEIIYTFTVTDEDGNTSNL